MIERGFDFLCKQVPLLRHLRFERRLNQAFTNAVRAPEPEDRIRWATTALELAASETWPYQRPTLGTLHSIRGQALAAIANGGKPEFYGAALEDLERNAALLTKGDGPAWADLMYNLGNLYMERTRGRNTGDQDKAIAIFEELHSTLSPQKQPQQWAVVRGSLGCAYSARIHDGHATNIDKAIELIESVLPYFEQNMEPEDRVRLLGTLANCYAERRQFDRTDNAQKARDLLESALALADRDGNPRLWAGIQINRGDVFARQDNIHAAIQCYEKAVSALSDFPVDRAEAILRLSSAREAVTSGSRRDNVEAAVLDARTVADSISLGDEPVLWARAQVRLGNALAARRGPEQRQYLEEAIRCFEAAIASLSLASDAEESRAARMSLANALALRIGNRRENLERTIALQQEELQMEDPGISPSSWASSAFNLALSYMQRLCGSRADNVEHALALLEQGLAVLKPVDYGRQRSELLETLGDTMGDRLRGDPLRNAEDAVQAYKTAWPDRDRDADPEGWARLRRKNDNALRRLSRFSQESEVKPKTQINSDVDADEFIEARCAEFAAVSFEDYPYAWASGQSHVAGLYLSTCSKGTNGDDIFTDQPVRVKKALEIYEGILERFPRELDPFVWGRTKRSVADCFTLLHLFEDLHHRGFEGLKDRSDPQLPNRSPLAMQYLDSAASALSDACSVAGEGLAPHEHLELTLLLGRCHLWRRDWASAAAAYDSAAAAAGTVLLEVDVCETEFQSTLRAVGSLSTEGPFAAAMSKDIPRALDLFEIGRARVLAKALAMASVPMTDTVRREFREILKQISVQEDRLVGPNLFERLTPLNESIRLRKLYQDSLGDVRILEGIPVQENRLAEPNLFDRFTPLNESIRLRRRYRESLAETDLASFGRPGSYGLLEQGTRDEEITAIPLFTDAGGCIIIGHRQNGNVSTQIEMSTDAVTLQSIYDGSAKEKFSSWRDAYLRLEAVMRNDDVDLVDLRRWGRSVETTAKHLGKMVAGPLFRHHDGNAAVRLNLLPQGALGLLPVVAAVHEESGTRLIDRFEVSLHPSLTALAHARGTPAHARRVGTLAVIRQMAAATESLPQTEFEADFAGSWFATDSVRMNTAGMSKKQVLEVLRNADVWHFASHGEFDSKAPVNSGLKLSQSELLTLNDLLEADDLGSPELVILSACCTGLYGTKDLPNEFVGLPTGFLQIGAKSVIATLWPVEDLSTALLIARFYDEYLGNGKEACSALRSAQLWLRDVTATELLHQIDQWAGRGHLNPAAAEEVHRDIVRMVGALKGDPDAPPFESPAYWAAFVHFGA